MAEAINGPSRGTPGEVGLAENAVGFPTALATAVGLIIASSVLLTATQGFGVAGPVFAIAIVIAYVLNMLQATSFSEAAGMMPLAGSVYDYISAGLGRFLGITGTLAAYLIVHVFAGTAETAAAGIFAAVNFTALEGLAESGSWIIGVSLLIIFGVVNMLGIRVYGGIEVVMTAIMWGTVTLFGILGVLMAPQVDLASFFGTSLIGSDWQAVLAMVGLATFLFVGVEYVTPLASELREPGKLIPRAMFVGLTAVAVSMFLYGAGVLRQVENVELPDGSLLFDTPLPIPEFGTAILGNLGRWWIAIAVLLASAATLNTLLAGIPRILYGMAKDGALPSAFAYLHPRFKTPWVGIALTVLIPAVYAIIIDGDINRIFVLILAAVAAWLTSYILVSISVMVLRYTKPDLARPYRAPWFPLPQILAIVGMLITLWYIAPPFLTRGAIYTRFGIILGVSAAFALIWTLAVMRKPLFEPVDPTTFVIEERGGA
jgi:amino acid transporter